MIEKLKYLFNSAQWKSSTTYVPNLIVEIFTKEYRQIREKSELRPYCIDIGDTVCGLITILGNPIQGYPINKTDERV